MINRIDSLTNMVAPSGVVADIGCDHCLTLIRLLTSGVCHNGIGCDIKRGPLERARSNIEKYGLSDKIELRLGFGLDKIKAGEAEAIIISGMGGRVINSILEKGAHIAITADQLILQPQNYVDETRRLLHGLGFCISSENMVTERGKYYTIIKAEKGLERYDREIEYAFGKKLIENKNAVLRDYLFNLLKDNKKLCVELAKQNSANCVNRISVLEYENQMIKEALKCL